MQEEGKMISIKSIMTKDVVTISPEMPIYEALNIFKSYQVSGLPVVDTENYVVGLLSEKDVLKLLLDRNVSVDDKVRDYMTKDIISFSENDDAIDVCKFFIHSHIRRVPIISNKKLVGVVSRRDIVLLILEAKNKMSSLRYV